MSKNWEELRDKGPPVEEPQHRHQRKRSGKKPFVIEQRYVGPEHEDGWFKRFYADQRVWRVYRRYKTAKQRDQAFVSVERKKKNHGANRYGGWYRRWEYRVNESDT